MSFPTSPNDAPPPGSGSGGGFGPPQGFGPPPASGGYGGYGPPAGGPAAPGGFGPATPAGYGQGGYGGYPPPPPPGGGRGPKIAAAVVGTVVVVAIVIGGLVWLGSGGKGDTAAKGGARSTAPAAPGDGSSTAPGASIPGPAPTSGGRSMPYVELKPGTCFDSPSLDNTVSVITTIACGTAHDGEVISDESLTGTVSSEQDLRNKALDLCAPDAKQRLRSIPADGRNYYNYALYPDMATYQAHGEDTVSCALTLSDSQNGAQLTRALP